MAEPGPEALQALEAEGAKTTEFLRGIEAAGWSAPTRCPPWTVRELVVHMLAMVEHMAETAGRPPVESPPVKDRISWWDYDIAEDQAATAEWVEKAAQDYPPGPLAEAWSKAVAACVAAVRRALTGGDPVVQPGEQPILLSDYVATRVLEITIHTMDVRDAFDLPPDPSPEGLAITLGILNRRLGADPLAMGFDGADFVIASTGRRTLDARDRERLGGAAQRLPLLA